jgi:hypothetical protein
VQKEAKQNGQQTVLVHDQLFINSVLYQCDDNMDELHQANDTRNESRPAEVFTTLFDNIGEPLMNANMSAFQSISIV